MEILALFFTGFTFQLGAQNITLEELQEIAISNLFKRATAYASRSHAVISPDSTGILIPVGTTMTNPLA
jgi:hypothetical protein